MRWSVLVANRVTGMQRSQNSYSTGYSPYSAYLNMSWESRYVHFGSVANKARTDTTSRATAEI